MTDDPHTIITHQQWAGRRVTLICGPPGSGKSTLAATLHPAVIELENYTHATLRDNLRAFGKDAYRTGRNPSANTAVIRCAPTLDERQHQEQLCRPSRTIIRLTDPVACHERINTRGRADLDFQHAGVDEWWQQYDPDA